MAFGEALVPGYPFWLELTDGARFNSPRYRQKGDYFANEYRRSRRYNPRPAISTACAPPPRATAWPSISGPSSARRIAAATVSTCSLVFIDARGQVGSVHRKLMPTYEERLVWSIGDGYGLRTHPVGAFRAGGLNCWENWMPLARTALYAQGEDLHVAVWPGSVRNTQDITRFIARESRSYVVSVSGLMRREDIGRGSLEWRDAVAKGLR